MEREVGRDLNSGRPAGPEELKDPEGEERGAESTGESEQEKTLDGQMDGASENSHHQEMNENNVIYSPEESEQMAIDEAKLAKTREMIDNIGNEAGGAENEPQGAAEGMGQKEKLDKVLEEEGSFNEKFELLKALREEKFEFEIKGFVSSLSQKMADMSGTKEKREEFIGNIAKAIRKAREGGRLPADFFDGLDGMISVGSGHGENPFGILQEYMRESRVILIDPDAAPAKDIAEDARVAHLGQKFEDVKLAVKPGEKNLVEASNFLQLYETKEEKVAMLKKMIRLAGVGGKLLIVDEVEREGLAGTKDWLMNRGFNAFKGNYARLKPGEYEEIFQDLGLNFFTNGEKD